MKVSEVKTYEDIVKYIYKETCGETSDSVYGINLFKKYAADEDQSVIIEEWIKELWEDIKDDLLEKEKEDEYLFMDVPILGKFIHNTYVMVKIIDESTGIELGINHIGERELISPKEVVERA